MYYYIIALLVFFSNYNHGSDSGNPLSVNCSNGAHSQKDGSSVSFTDTFSVSFVDDTSDGKKQENNPALSKFLAVAKIAEAKRRLSVSIDSMERSRRASLSSDHFGSQSLEDSSKKNSPDDKLSTKEALAAKTPTESSETKEVKK